jgi:hypothetical protein
MSSFTAVQYAQLGLMAVIDTAVYAGPLRSVWCLLPTNLHTWRTTILIPVDNVVETRPYQARNMPRLYLQANGLVGQPMPAQNVYPQPS